MERQTQATNHDQGTLAGESGAFVAATADVIGQPVNEGRNRLAAALESGKEILGRVKEKAVESARATDECVHEHPYQTIGVAFGLGALIGFLIARRGPRNGG